MMQRIEPGDTRVQDLHPVHHYAGQTEEPDYAAQFKHEQRSRWTPPKGHDSWCFMQQPVVWRHKGAGETPMARQTCNCTKRRR